MSPDKGAVYSTGPSWEDVRYYMHGMSRAQNGVVWVVMGLKPVGTSGTQLYYRVCFARGLRASDYHSQYEEAHVWPASDWKTVPAMLYALLYRLEAKIEEYKVRAERQASF